MAKEIVTPMPAAPRTPSIYIDLTKADVGELKGLKVGEQAKVVIVGKVISISMRLDDKEKTGSFSIESSDVSIKDAPNGDMAELAEDEDGSD